MRKDKVDIEGYSKAEVEGLLGIKRGRIQEWIPDIIKPYWKATKGQTARFNRLNCYQIYLAATMLNGRASKIDVFDMINTIKSFKYLVRFEKQTAPVPLTQWKPMNEVPQIELDKFVSFYVIDLQQIRKLVDKKLA